MKKITTKPGTLKRRSFVAGCMGCTLGTAVMARSASPLCTLSCKELHPQVKTRVRLTFSHSDPTTPIWPNIGYDFEGRKQEITRQLQTLCPEIEFLPTTLKSGEQAQRLATEDNIDGYVCFILGLGKGLVAPTDLIESGKPVILADDLYGGTGRFLGDYRRAIRQKRKVVGISSSKMEDVAQAAKMLIAIKKLKRSKILDVTERKEGNLWGGVKTADFKRIFGTDIELLAADRLNREYESADKKAAADWARYWMRKARKVVEPTKQEIEKSAATYLSMQSLMRKHHAQAITIDCLGLYYSKKVFAYPCLGFFQLNNDGLVGACESDLYSTITQLSMGYLTGQPGFISDPVIDTSKNRIIYAHCVAMNKVYGPEGKSNAYDIRDHSEDRKGAAVRSLMPLHKMTTTMIFRPDKNLVVMHQGKTVENVDEDKACRTKLASEVSGDIYKLLRGWDHGWHRVTFYGDHKRTVEDFATLLGMDVIHEA